MHYILMSGENWIKKGWELAGLEKAPKNKQNNHFLNFRPPPLESYRNGAKFDDNPQTLTKEDVWVVCQSSPEKDMLWKLEFWKANFPHEDKVISNKQPILLGFFSSFNYFCRSYLGKGETRERIQKATLASFQRKDSEGNFSKFRHMWSPGNTNEDHYKHWLVHLYR